MEPKSVVRNRRFTHQILWIFVPLTVASIILGFLAARKGGEGIIFYATFFTAAIALIAGLILFLNIDSGKSNARETRQTFDGTFGIGPYEDPELVQRAVSAVLEGLRLRAQGAFGREIGAQRKHRDTPT